ncbi:transglycosylase [Escherichia marmotae]|uniref:transglycosylase n=1 Tax=Escherichia marmotae TaxID=1499973 RepID=UPI002016B251|nr:transglycosylase [Escherichia marmotae]
MITADVSEVILNDKKDRIAIIDAIQTANAKELAALSEIKKALESYGRNPDTSDAPQGRVSRRLARTGKAGAQRNSFIQGPYKDRLPTKKQRLRINNTSEIDNPQKAADHRTAHSESKTAPLAEGKATKSSPERIQSLTSDIQPARQEQPVRENQSIAGAPLRDSNGRFASQKKNEDLARQNELRAQAKLQVGFLRKLGSIMGVDGSGKADDGAVADAAGVGAGGPLWMAARGVFDISREITGKAKSLKEWIDNGNDKAAGAPVVAKAPAITYPAPDNERKTPDNAPGSAKAFTEAVKEKSVRAIEEQTKVLQRNDSQIIDELETVSEEIRKLRKSQESGLKLSDLFGGGRLRTKISPTRGRSSARGGNTGRTGDSKENKGRKGKNTSKPTETGRSQEGKEGKKNQPGKNNSAGEEKNRTKNAGGNEGSTSPKSSGDKSSVKTRAGKATEESVAKTAAGGAAGKDAGKAATSAGESLTRKEAGKVAVATGENIAKKEAGKVALKAAGGVAARAGFRAIPVIGQVAMVDYDAVDGYSDTEAQRATYNLKEGQDVTTQQKSAYAAANVLDMGGLVTGAANLIGEGMSALGFEGVGQKLQSLDTSNIARGINSSIDASKNAFSSLKESFSSSSEGTAQVKKAVEDGTKQTVAAINDLARQLQGGRRGEDGVGEHGYKSPDEFKAPEKNTITADLNIGGSNAKNRNYRNNNLGNLVFANQEGAVLEAPNAKGEQRFARFNTPEEGIRALANQVSSYYNGTSAAAGYQKLQTVSSIISKWAPPTENNTNQYIENVSKYLGVSPNDKIDVSNPEVMTHLVRAIATKEGGNPAVNNNFIKTALGSFNAKTGRWEGQFNDETLEHINKIQKEKGGPLIARNSQYSVGSKVKYANGSSSAIPASSVAQAVMPSPADVVQHAQAAKKPKAAQQENAQAISHAKASGNSSAAAGLTERLMSADGVGGVIAGIVGGDPNMGLNLGPASSPEEMSSLAAKAKQLDKFLVEKISRATGKNFSFQKAEPIADITTAIQQKRNVNRDTETIDLLPESPATISEKRATSTPAGVQIYDNGYKVVEGEDRGFFGSLFDSTVSGLNQVGSAVLPAVGDNLSRLVGGIDSTGMLNDFVLQSSGQNTDVARAISPLTRSVGGWLNGGIQKTADTIRDTTGAINQSLFASGVAAKEPFLAMPPQLPTVTDLARSGIRQMLTTDTANNDPAMLKALENVYSVLKEILGVSKDNRKGDQDKVVNTSQPQPRQRASTTINDPSLDKLLED